MDELWPVARALRKLGLRHCATGNLALRHWGVERDLPHVDILFWAGFGQERDLSRRLLDEGLHVPLRDPASFAEELRVLPVHAAKGPLVNLSFGALPFEDTVLGRALPAEPLPLASAEDVLLLKLFSMRPADWEDARALAVAQRARLQWPYIDFWLPQLAELKGDPRLLDWLSHPLATIHRV